MVDTPGGAVGSAPVAWQPVGASNAIMAVAAATGTATAVAYFNVVGSASGTSTCSGVGLTAEQTDAFAFGLADVLGDGRGLFYTTASSEGSSTAASDATWIAAGTGSSSGSSSSSVVSSALAASRFVDDGEPYGYGGVVGSAPLGEIPLGSARFDKTGSTVIGVGAWLAASAGQSTATSSAAAITGFIGVASGSSTAGATVGSIASASGSATVNGYFVVTGLATGSSSASGVGALLYALQGSAAGSSTADAANGSIAATVGNAPGSCTVKAYQLWQDIPQSGQQWNFPKYEPGVGGAVGSAPVGVQPVGATDLEPASETASWEAAPTTSTTWNSAETPTTPNWQPVTTTSTTWQKAA